jgi:putative transport protein
MIRELGIALFLASVGLSSGHNLAGAFADGSGYRWIGMGIAITMIPLVLVGLFAKKFLKKNWTKVK